MCSYTVFPYGLQLHNRSSQFSGVFCDSQAFSGIMSISRDSRLPLHKRTNKISRKNEILILLGTGCIAANGTPQKCAVLHFWTNGQPCSKNCTVPRRRSKCGGQNWGISNSTLLAKSQGRSQYVVQFRDDIRFTYCCFLNFGRLEQEQDWGRTRFDWCTSCHVSVAPIGRGRCFCCCCACSHRPDFGKLP